MEIELLNGWLLHKKAISDSRFRLYFFSEKGIIEGSYRSSRKDIFLQTFAELWITLRIKNNYHYFDKIEAGSAALSFKNQSLFASLYVNELIYTLLKPNDAFPQLFHAYVHTLKGLTLAEDRLTIEALLRRFEWQLLHNLGYAPDLTKTADTQEAILAGRNYTFVADYGFIAASEGYSGADLSLIAKGNFDQVHILRPAKLFMRQVLHPLLGGKSLKSRELFHKN